MNKKRFYVCYSYRELQCTCTETHYFKNIEEVSDFCVRQYKKHGDINIIDVGWCSSCDDKTFQEIEANIKKALLDAQKKNDIILNILSYVNKVKDLEAQCSKSINQSHKSLSPINYTATNSIIDIGTKIVEIDSKIYNLYYSLDKDSKDKLFANDDFVTYADKKKYLLCHQ